MPAEEINIDSRSAELLLNGGGLINAYNDEGWRPLHNAIKAGLPQMVTLLLEKGASPDECTEAKQGSPPLHPLIIAAQHKRADIAKILVTKCKNLNPTDQAGRTPMHIASENGAAEIVGSLVMHGANVNVTDNQGVVPLQLAISGDYDDICHTLTTNGADVSLRYAAGKASKRRQSDAEAIDMVTHADRYGHLSANLSPEVDGSKVNAKKVKKEMERANKWSKMIKKWESFSTKKSVKVISRAEKGIPDCVRGEAWKRLCWAAREMEQHKEKYAELCARKSKWVTQIDLDVNRSSRNHLQFRERYGKGQVALFTILKAYSVYDEEVGYCQGMSDITSLLLKYVTEQEAFWMLERLMYDPKYNMRELVLPGFPRLQASFLIHDALLEEYAPALADHFKKENVVPAFYATKWYLMAFLDIFPFDITLRLWDVLLAEGYDIVFSIAINVLIMYQDKLFGKSFDKIMAFLRSMESKEIDTDKFLASILKNKISSRAIKRVAAKLKKKNSL